MIIISKGKARSQQTTAERLQLLRQMNRGDPDCWEAARGIMEYKEKGRENQAGEILGLLKKLHYDYPPVDLDTFLWAPLFLGLDRQQFRPVVARDLKELFSGNYSLVILTGAIGWGKSTMGAIIAARMLYELGCLKEPQASLGLRSGTRIDLLALSTTLRQAHQAFYEPLIGLVKNSPFFMQALKCRITKDELRLVAKNVCFQTVAATSTAALSLNTYGAFMDEADFYGTTKDRNAPGSGRYVDRAQDLFGAYVRRMDSRYLQPGGYMTGRAVLMSSTGSNTGFIEKQIYKSQDDPRVFVRQYANFDVRDWWTAGSENKKRQIG